MTIPVDVKVPELIDFYAKLEVSGWQFHGSTRRPTAIVC
jgi:hypothetical protein